MIDDEPRTRIESGSESSINDAQYSPYAGAFFPSSHDFIVSGGTFKSVTNYNTTVAKRPCDFRRIPLGDIDLQSEIRLNGESTVVRHERGQGTVRRMYSAKIHGQRSNMTVALYEGEKAEERWRQEITKYSSLRHPNVVQIYGIANSSSIYAIAVHDNLILYCDYVKLYGRSHFSMIYICGHSEEDFHDAYYYFWDTFRNIVYHEDCTFWIRLSTHRLCLELTPSNLPKPSFSTPCLTSRDPRIMPSSGANLETTIIRSLELTRYHAIVHWQLGRLHVLPVPPHIEVKVGTLIYCPSGSQLDGSVEVASLIDVKTLSTYAWTIDNQAPMQAMKNHWTRFKSCDILGAAIECIVTWADAPSWLSQANYIFSRLPVTSNREDYVMLTWIAFRLEISTLPRTPPDGYLFVCPEGDLEIRRPNKFQWHNQHPAYWSLDAGGVERLTMNEAMCLGFPSIRLAPRVHGYSWDAGVYSGVREFHEARGFDSDSQDVARHLGQPLYQLYTEIKVPLAHIDGMESVEEKDGEIPDADRYSSYSKHQDLDLEGPPLSRGAQIMLCVKAALILFCVLYALYDGFRRD